MPSRALKTAEDREGFVLYLRSQTLPLTVSMTKGVSRSKAQNNTIHMWYGQVSAMLEACSLDVRAECKLTMGVPILRRDDPAFREWYDRDVRPMTYEAKLRLFRMLDPAVTSTMNVQQLTEYMDTMQRHFAQGGIVLADPDARKRVTA